MYRTLMFFKGVLITNPLIFSRWQKLKWVKIFIGSCNWEIQGHRWLQLWLNQEAFELYFTLWVLIICLALSVCAQIQGLPQCYEGSGSIFSWFSYSLLPSYRIALFVWQETWLPRATRSYFLSSRNHSKENCFSPNISIWFQGKPWLA